MWWRELYGSDRISAITPIAGAIEMKKCYVTIKCVGSDDPVSQPLDWFSGSANAYWYAISLVVVQPVLSKSWPHTTRC